ncbi:MAG TPA: glutathione S-transferase family protein [Gemmatimonadota bacterium]|nr:glutathione S-transferase family protein [Gemmatimonadota bacterium]
MRRLLEFYRSPNSVKVRIALEFKALEYETQEMFSADRDPIVRAGGWPLVPILLDGTVAMRDSSAILHYLEANYRDAPSMTPDSRDDILAAETVLANVSPHIRRAQWSVQGEIPKSVEEREAGRIAAARAALVEALEQLEQRLSRREWLVGERMSMYDVILACTLIPAAPPPAFVAESAIYRFFDEHFRIEEERPRTIAWVRRVLAHDTGAHRLAAR